MSLCPSSSHQLVAAAIAFRRARRKFPKDFGLENNAIECGNLGELSAKEDASPVKHDHVTEKVTKGRSESVESFLALSMLAISSLRSIISISIL
jgi:hypothetical protein